MTTVAAPEPAVSHAYPWHRIGTGRPVLDRNMSRNIKP
ncbi:expressed unknown protein [Ectocarpus siliculosus]|uniref:Uncharacterized protein n=1 Tax=Ectocarpus siliculosus TaxID=2880 RepID=D7G100_ECTSI|nr:expressed unknown protein [Ectocarpus siliculosus]|eukprot:CBJ33110.1 expressed unknown protein [Ectocarpus siliculosus]